MLPKEFTERMKKMLGEESPAFFAEYGRTHYQALRINANKAGREDFLLRAPFTLVPVPWAADGFYYDSADAPGKHPWHEAGVYYIQEPSAMAPAEYLMRPMERDAAPVSKDAEKNGEEDTSGHTYAGERILDLCAAPGGKSTQIASVMRGRGLLVCNEIHPARVKILSENVERMGISNAVVTNETPARLAERFPSYFTRILVDAPCSGEGMFRRNEEAQREWSPANVELCAARQDEILDCAAEMLAPGGRMVYSTCTFAPAENEGSIARFLTRHKDFYVEEVPLADGMEHGCPEWVNDMPEEESMRLAEMISRTIRLWPHRLQGEGHYLAVLRKEGELQPKQTDGKPGCESGIPAREIRMPGKGCAEYLGFAEEAFCENSPFAKEEAGRYLRFGEQLYRMPEGMPALSGLKVLRPGLHLGTVKKDRFEPSHALALALRAEDVKHSIDLPADDSEIAGYLRGETFPLEGEKGWYLVTVDGYSAGWGKLAGGVMKNHYPKGLRKGRERETCLHDKM